MEKCGLSKKLVINKFSYLFGKTLSTEMQLDAAVIVVEPANNQDLCHLRDIIREKHQ